MSERATLFGLAWKSLLNRRLTAGLTVASVAMSVMLLVAVDRIRTETKTSFVNTISGVDLVVGARGGPLNLLLYAVFRVGDATSNISWESYQMIAARPEVAWSVPLSLGDAHRGYRVLGTTDDYFAHYRYGRDRALAFETGEPFANASEAVLGAEVAATLGYAMGDGIVVSHGIGDVSFVHHDDAPFTVAGILAPTGTPVDRTVHVSLAGIEAMHSESGEHDHGHDGHSDDEDHDEHVGGGHDAHHDDEHAEHHDAAAHNEHHDDHAEHDDGHHAEHHGGEHDEHHAAAAHDEHRDDHAEHDDGHHAEHHDDEHAEHHDATDHDEHHADHAEHDDGHHAEHHDGDHDKRHESDGNDHAEHNNGEHDGDADEHHTGDQDEHGDGEHRVADDAEHHNGGHADDRDSDLAEPQPDAITAFLVGLHSRPLALRLQRFVNEYDGEPMMAILPGATLQQLWDLVGVVEVALVSVAVLVVAAGLIGMTTTLLAGLAERRREMAVLRAVGAGRGWVFALLIVESAMLAATAAIVGVAAAHGAMFAGRAVLEDRFGLALAGGAPGVFDLAVVLGVTLAGALAAAFPAWRAYRYSLADGLTVRV